MFLPTTRREMKELGWESCDVIIVTGDAYIDSPYCGAAAIGKYLLQHGFKVGVISQPDFSPNESSSILPKLTDLGEPRLWWGVTAGLTDSMVANYTALKKPRRQDDLTPTNKKDREYIKRRPDRASIAYVNLIRKNFKNTKPIILGGVEASLRRLAHYDYWSDTLRGSILFDAKADAIIYGEGERVALELSRRLNAGEEWRDLRSLCVEFKGAEPPGGTIELPSLEDVRASKEEFARMFDLFYKNSDPINAKPLAQRHGARVLLQNPPMPYLMGEDLDEAYELPYEYDAPKTIKAIGEVRALDTIRNSITTHRGCYGECNFCAITLQQGRRIRSRSEGSILREATRLAGLPGFNGIINDVGGASANMYGAACEIADKAGSCKNKRCVERKVCERMNISHEPQISLLQKLRKLAGVKHVFVASGIRYDLVIEDAKHGERYLREITENHVSGQLKIAPEHISPRALKLMGKPSNDSLVQFKKKFEELSRKAGKRQFLTYYFIAAHPGCGERETEDLAKFARENLGVSPEQTQIFTPTPSTHSTLMYYTERTKEGEPIFVEKGERGKRLQKEAITGGEKKKSRRR